MAFVHQVRVLYSDVDMQGVVFNGRWLYYFDDAMTQFMGSLGYDPTTLFAEEFDVMLVHADVDWRAAVGFNDVVDIEVTTARIGKTSFDLRFDARVGGETACEATITYVSIAPPEHRPHPIPDEVHAKLESMAS